MLRSTQYTVWGIHVEGPEEEKNERCFTGLS